LYMEVDRPKDNIIKKEEKSYNHQLDLFLEGIQLIFKNWSALRFCIDTHATDIFNNIVEVVNDQEEIIEELEFNIVIGTVNDKICSIIKKEKSTNLQEKTIAAVLKKFVEDYFFISLQDESEYEISCMIVKLDISKNSDTYLNKLKSYKNAVEYNIDFPCKIDAKVDLDDFYSSDEEEEELDEEEKKKKDENNTEIKEILEGKYKGSSKKNKNDLPPELVDELHKLNMKTEDNKIDDNNSQIEDDDGFVEVSSNKKKKAK
jgi:hypothetical protein